MTLQNARIVETSRDDLNTQGIATYAVRGGKKEIFGCVERNQGKLFIRVVEGDKMTSWLYAGGAYDSARQELAREYPSIGLNGSNLLKPKALWAVYYARVGAAAS